MDRHITKKVKTDVKFSTSNVEKINITKKISWIKYYRPTENPSVSLFPFSWQSEDRSFSVFLFFLVVFR